MNTFLKIGLGFVLGVIFTFGLLYIIGTTRNTEENQLREEIRMQALKNLKQSLDGADLDENGQENIQSFELTTKNGIVKLHTHMSKDSVKILMGRPQSTDVNDYGYNGKVSEIWKYKGTNRYVEEFTIEFDNGKLKSVDQFNDH
ncbi:MAG: hypothetical protein RLY43_681 [Bacteroidota bacterium]|jgi:hypothetical protein